MITWINHEDKLFLKIKEVVNKYDIMHLLMLGSPEDEYEPEIVDIINRCQHIYNPKKIGITIRDIFEFWFDKDFINNEQIDLMAKEIDKIFTKDLFEKFA
jgi:hypothetical protein